MSNTTSSSGGWGCGIFTVLLTLLFVVLKLAGVITWEWWVVLLPILIYFGLTIVLLVLAAVLVFIHALTK